MVHVYPGHGRCFGKTAKRGTLRRLWRGKVGGPRGNGEIARGIPAATRVVPPKHRVVQPKHRGLRKHRVLEPVANPWLTRG